MTTETERILTLELNFKNFMEKVEEKFNIIIEKFDELPKIYTTKSEFSGLCNKVENIEKQKIMTENKKVERIKNWGMIIVALISSIVSIITVLSK